MLGLGGGYGTSKADLAGRRAGQRHGQHPFSNRSDHQPLQGRSAIRHGAGRKPHTHRHVLLIFALITLYSAQAGRSGVLGLVGTAMGVLGTTLIVTIVFVDTAGAHVSSPAA